MARSAIGMSAIKSRISKVFTPTRPIMERELFAGRHDELRKIEQAVGQPGQHIIVYGERGVGKTSFANITLIILPIIRQSAATIVTKVNANKDDSFTSLILKLFRSINISESKNGIGFISQRKNSQSTLADHLPQQFSSFEIRSLIQTIASSNDIVLIVDEFDRLQNKIAIQVADLIKELSDFGTNCTIIIVGVAENISDLIGAHPSTERALKQIHMPRMKFDEISEIIRTGAGKTGLDIDDESHDLICELSCGVPFFTHQLCLHAFTSSVDRQTGMVELPDVRRAIKLAIEDSHQSLKTAYITAVSSPQPENIFKQVVLSCALAEKNDVGTFSPSDLKIPLARLMGRSYEIASFSRHLTELISENRGHFLVRVGSPRRYRYKFGNPLFQPYVMMRGYAEGLISHEER